MSNHGRDFAGQPTYFPDFSAATTAEEPYFVEYQESPNPTPPPPPPAIADVEQGPARMPSPKAALQKTAPRKSAPPPPPPAPINPAKSQTPTARKAIPALFVPPPVEKKEKFVPWEKRFKEWLHGEGGKGWGVSLLIHAFLLLALWLIVFSIPKVEERLITTIDDSEVADVAGLENIQIEGIPDDEVPQIDDPRFDPGLPHGNNPLAPSLSSLGVGLGTSAGSLLGTKGGGLKLAIPSQAITKGSFTVWTVPEDPQPGQQYVIMIQVKLKTAVRRYPRSDLNGNVVGTDGYRDYFGGPTEPGFLPVTDDAVQVQACVVPGAAVLVKDVITVESKILKEKQVIEIVF